MRNSPDLLKAAAAGEIDSARQPSMTSAARDDRRRWSPMLRCPASRRCPVLPLRAHKDAKDMRQKHVPQSPSVASAGRTCPLGRRQQRRRQRRQGGGSSRSPSGGFSLPNERYPQLPPGHSAAAACLSRAAHETTRSVPGPAHNSPTTPPRRWNLFVVVG